MSSSVPTATSKAPRSLPALVVAFFSSFGLATTTLVLLLIIVLLGTLDQVDNGLYASQTKYFESMLVWGVDFGKTHIPIILPGGYLLMIILTVNILLGGVRRIRTTPKKLGILIAHLSMVFLLLAGAVSYFFKKDGNMALLEGRTSDEFQSFHDSVIEIERVEPTAKDGKRSAMVIPGNEYYDLDAGKARVFTSTDLPFDFEVMNYMENGTPRQVKPGETHPWEADGYYLQAKVPEKDQELNLDAATIKVINKKDKQEEIGLLWRGEDFPFVFRVDDQLFNVRLARRTWKLPFAVRLDKFIREVHPGTEESRRFTSEVTQIKDGHDDKKIITMNAPLRDSGYILFQASFNQGQVGNSLMSRSVFAVVQNPADQWPLMACVAAAAGLLLHMFGQLFRFIRGSQPKKVVPPPVPIK